MTESRTGPVRPNGWSGLAGLLIALFVVAGLVAGYGLGHAPPMRICTEHAVSAPIAAAAATPGGPPAGAAVAPAAPDAPFVPFAPPPGPASTPASGPMAGLLSGPVSNAALGSAPALASGIASGPVSDAAHGAAHGFASGGLSGGLSGLVGAVHADVAPLPLDLPGPPAGDVCLCLAVLLTLMAIGLSGGARRPFLRLPARAGRVAAPPTGAAFAAPSLSALQVLRL
ncbi:hypothetical protein ACFHW2_18980 [Actinomadura sp. LOL_016]|uniref:hypothetical protein n=1 Tax=unclassified Actinomadura TaxID=2626254 RepID=UPI003A80943D